MKLIWLVDAITDLDEIFDYYVIQLSGVPIKRLCRVFQKLSSF